MEYPVKETRTTETVLLVIGGKHFERSSAVLQIAIRLRFPWPLLGFFFVLPRFIRDPLYDLVARNRKRWFGERATCYIP
jgi:predicted DCC family thiol-disulfide oxidoreductase YuxK